MLRDPVPVRAARAEQVVCAIRDWQRRRISVLELARRCPCTFSEWNRIWPKIARNTPDALMVRLVFRVMRAGKVGA